MAAKGPGSSTQSLTVLQRTARLFEGEHWWLFDRSGEVRGLLLFDGGEDLACLRDDLGGRPKAAYRFHRGEKCGEQNNPPAASSRSNLPRPDCQVTIEERTQLFGFLKKG